MNVTEPGMFIEVKDEQQKNAPAPMNVTESGMFIEVKDEQ